MVTMETRDELEQIDHQIKELVERRLKLTTRSDLMMSKSESALAGRKYERELLHSLSDPEDYNLENCERMMFQTLFNVSHSYVSSQNGKKSELSETIKKALETTAPEFPKSALVACQGVEGA